MDNNSLADKVKSNPVTYSVTVIQVITLLLLIIIINFNFTIYQLYMRKKPEFSNRLLNVLYSFHAYLLQFGSFLILLIFCDKNMDIDIVNALYRQLFPPTKVLVKIRMFHLSCVFINIFNIGIATAIQNFKMDLYLVISLRITKKIICMTTFLISILINIFVKVQFKENDEELEKYQSVIKIVCVWLNMIALAVCFLVILGKMIFYLKEHFFTFLGQARDYSIFNRTNVTPITTIEIEMGRMEVVNNDVFEQQIINVNNNLINYGSGIEEYIRWVGDFSNKILIILVTLVSPPALSRCLSGP